MLVFFKHHDAGAFAEHKAIAIPVPGTGRRLRVVVAGRQRTHGGKTANAERRYRRFGAAGDRHVCVAVFNHSAGLTDAVQARGAGGDHRKVRPLEAKAHGYMPSHHIDDGRWNEKRRDAARPPGHELCVGVFDQRQAANARADDAGNACGQLIVQCLACGQAGVVHCLHGRSDAEMNERIHPARILGAEVGAQIKTAHFPGNLAGEVRRIKFGDAVDTGAPGQEVGPGVLHRVSHGTNATQAGHDNATTAHS